MRSKFTRIYGNPNQSIYFQSIDLIGSPHNCYNTCIQHDDAQMDDVIQYIQQLFFAFFSPLQIWQCNIFRYHFRTINVSPHQYIRSEKPTHTHVRVFSSATFSFPSIPSYCFSHCLFVFVWLCACILLMTSRTILFHPILALSGTNFAFSDVTWFAFSVPISVEKRNETRRRWQERWCWQWWAWCAKFDTAIYTSWFTMLSEHSLHEPSIPWLYKSNMPATTFVNMRERVFSFHDEFK